MRDFQTLLSSMTLQQKAAQLTQFGAEMLNDPDHPDLTGLAGSLQVSPEDLATAGSTFNTSGPKARIAIQKEHMENDPNHIPLVFMQDVIHGFKTIYPIPLAMAASFDPELVEEMAALAAEEATAAGVDVAFSPMVDLSRDARWGRVMEGAGEDIHLNCVMAAAQVRGYMSKGMHSCVKHYAAYGAGEAGRDYNMVDMSETRLRERFLPAYKAALDAGARCIMPSFNSLNGVPSVANKLLMNQILRQEWGFDGLVVSDYGAVGELIRHGAAEDSEQAAQLALECGCHYEMMTAHYLHSLQKLLDEGRITMEQVDEAVLRVLQFKDEMGLFDHPDRFTDAEKYASIALTPESREKVRKAAEQCAVLLKNDDLLPLGDQAKKIAVIGPFADDGDIQGGWAVNGEPEKTVTILQGIRNRIPEAEVRYAAGCGKAFVTADCTDVAQAAELAAWADQVILVLGEGGNQSGEAQSRTHLELSDAQLALFRAVVDQCEDTVVLLMAGRPLAIPEIAAKAKAILCMWQPGTEGGNAAARLIYGDVCPSGHLPMSFPYTTGQVPISYDMYNTGRMPFDPFRSEGNPFQSSYQDGPMMPLYPFGHGLTYTKFELKDAHLSADSMTRDGKIEATVTVANTGSRAAECVVQLYLHDCAGSRVRPVRELKAFRKVHVEAGSAVDVSFEITDSMLRFETLEHGFASETGKFEAILAMDAWSGEKLPFVLK